MFIEAHCTERTMKLQWAEQQQMGTQHSVSEGGIGMPGRRRVVDLKRWSEEASLGGLCVSKAGGGW